MNTAKSLLCIFPLVYNIPLNEPTTYPLIMSLEKKNYVYVLNFTVLNIDL